MVKRLKTSLMPGVSLRLSRKRPIAATAGRQQGEHAG
jgi:hypothetical protein